MFLVEFIGFNDGCPYEAGRFDTIEEAEAFLEQQAPLSPRVDYRVVELKIYKKATEQLVF